MLNQSQQKIEYFCSDKSRINKQAHKWRIKYKAISRDDLDKVLVTSIQTIDKMSYRLTAFDTMPSDDYFGGYRHQYVCLSNGGPQGVISLYPDDSVQEDEQIRDTRISNDISFLSSINEVNKGILRSVRAGNKITDVEVYLHDPIITNNINTRYDIYTIWSVSLVDGQRCDKCKTLRERSEMSKHQLHPECLIEVDKQRMADADMVKIESVEDVIAIRSAGLKHNMISEFWACYVPRWTCEAIAAFNKSGGNYAGMTLEEFLKSVKPDGDTK